MKQSTLFERKVLLMSLAAAESWLLLTKKTVHLAVIDVL